MVSELARLFLKLGITSFGGPAAHVALMEEEFVHKRQWLSREKFLDLIALTNLIPGPNSTELAIHIGYLRAGWLGFAVAGLCFILPAFLIVALIAAFYTAYASLPEVQSFLVGAKAVVFAVILFAFERFAKSLWRIDQWKELFYKNTWSEKRRVLVSFIFIASIYMSLVRGYSEILILFNCGLISLFISARFPRTRTHELGTLFWVFFKIGAVLFGSGYVLLSFLQTELVQARPWLTQSQLLDAVTVGQFTPGPVFTTATFIGYLLHGPVGAVLATVGIFTPAFLFVALSIPLYKKLETSLHFRAILDGVVAGSLGLLFTVFWTFGPEIAKTALTLGIFIVSLVFLKRTRFPSAGLIFLGGLLSFFATKI